MFKVGELKMIEKVRTSLVYDRLKVVRYADRKAWKEGLHYEGDNIAETESEAK